MAFLPAVFVSWVMPGMINRVMDWLAGISDVSVITCDVKKTNATCMTKILTKSLILVHPTSNSLPFFL